MPKPIDKMTLKEIEAEIEGMGFALSTQHAGYEGGKWTYYLYEGIFIRKWGQFRWLTELGAARAALRWLKERERK